MDRSMEFGEEPAPFTVPSDEKIFFLRDMERMQRKEEKKDMKQLKVHQKTTQSSRMGTTKINFPELNDDTVYGEDESGRGKGRGAGKRDGKYASLEDVAQNTMLERHKEKENMHDFIQKKRDMFLVQMALDTKSQEIVKLEERAAQREAALKKSEEMLEDDHQRFEKFLKDNDDKAVKATKRAEAETKEKNDRVAEIKKLNARITAVKADINKHNEALSDCERYRSFLDGLTPPEWFELQAQLKAQRRNERRQAFYDRVRKAAEKEFNVAHKALIEEQRKDPKILQQWYEAGTPDGPKPNLDEVRLKPEDQQHYDNDSFDSHEDVPMYFKEPGQLLSIFTQLEENNLFLIQNSQETEEALDDLRSTFASTKERLDAETSALQMQIDKLSADIAEEESKATLLDSKIKEKESSGGSAMQSLLQDLNLKVQHVYGHAIQGEKFDQNMNTLQMLVNIETTLDRLLRDLKTRDQRAVNRVEKDLERTRRRKRRDERELAKKKSDEAKSNKARERAMQETTTAAKGKPVMFRSERVRKQEEKEEVNNDDEEEYKLFFTWE